MRLKLKVGALIVGVVLLVAASVAVAYAGTPQPQQSVALQVGAQGTGYDGSYGDFIDLQPASMTCIERPGDKFHFQVYISNVDSQGVSVGQQWTDFRDFEDIQLDDTNTVQPFSYQLGIDDAVILGDGTVVYPTPPYQIRCEYKTADTSGTVGSTSPPSFSETETVNVDKNSTGIKISTSGTVKHNGTKFNFTVTPDSGVGTIQVTVKKSGQKTKTYNLTTSDTDDMSASVASSKLKLGSNTGTYKVSAKFLGNIWGSSSSASKSIHAAH